MPFQKFAALIPAAGFSTRMSKGFKPLLPIPFADKSRSALEALARLYAEAGIERIVVVGGPHRGEDLAAEAKRLGLVHVFNPLAEKGMFSSVRAGLEALADMGALGAPGPPGAMDAGAGCFVHPADIPLVRLFTIRALLDEAQRHPDDVLVPHYMGREGHPPFVPTAHLPAILAWKGGNGLRGALSRLPCRRLPVADRNILLDMDRDEDHDEVCKRARRHHILEPEEAEELLRLLGVEERGMAHAVAVAAVAKRFALACNAAGGRLDPLLAQAGGLLHDMCKGQPRHERAAGEKLRSLGLPAMARLVEEHRDCALADHEALTEKELVYLADKYVYGDRPVSLQERFGQKLALFADNAEAREAIRGRLARAEAMERRLQRESGAIPFALACGSLKTPCNR